MDGRQHQSDGPGQVLRVHGTLLSTYSSPRCPNSPMASDLVPALSPNTVKHNGTCYAYGSRYLRTVCALNPRSKAYLYVQEPRVVPNERKKINRNSEKRGMHMCSHTPLLITLVHPTLYNHRHIHLDAWKGSRELVQRLIIELESI